jgi:hypothetical protein
MLLFNFSHSLPEDQRAQIETIARQPITEIRAIPAQFDNARPFDGQICQLAASARLSPLEWQLTPILVNPPAYNFTAMTLLAELQGG